jgi:hypothetical protein
MHMARSRVTRRAITEAAIGAAAFTALGCRGEGYRGAKPANPVAEPAANANQHDLLDEALTRLAPTGPEYAGRLANHAPMTVEALVTLGRGDAVHAWIDRYVGRLHEWPPSGGRIAQGAWSDALGKDDRITDWRAFFTEELREHAWRDVMATWAPRLAAGVSGSAGHGIIRTSHVVRALAARESPERRAELASALAYWAASFHRLPEQHAPGPALTVEQALAKVEVVPAGRRAQGPIVDRLEPLQSVPSFAKVADWIDVSGDPSETLTSLTRAFARVYISNASQRDGRIARLHQVTGTSAVRLLAPHLGREALELLLRYIWQLDAAVYATNTTPGAEPPTIEPFPTPHDLVAAAVEGGDEHAIKLTEVCLREHAVAADPAYLAAAAHWVRAS